VSDVNMPEMSGFDLTEKVRSDRLLRHVSVILVAALDPMQDQAHGPTWERTRTSRRARSTTTA